MCRTKPNANSSKTGAEEQMKIRRQMKIDVFFKQCVFQKAGVTAFPSRCTLKIRYEGLSDYFLKCCLGELSAGYGADPLLKQIAACFYTS